MFVEINAIVAFEQPDAGDMTRAATDVGGGPHPVGVMSGV
jgi:hypothetical protein